MHESESSPAGSRGSNEEAPASDAPSPAVDRRTVLAAAGAAAASSAVPTVGAQSDDLEAFFEDVDNYDGLDDHTDDEQVTVSVGAGDDGLLYEPAAIRIEAGTTVVWEWTGEGGQHDVAEVDGAFESELTDEAGHTFEQTFEDVGEYRYVCTPHEGLGMKGAVVVQPPDPTPEIEAFLADVEEYDGIVDERGNEEVSVAVGAGDDGLRYDPPAVRVDPGATVEWEWTGEGGQHDVAEVDDAFQSELTDEAGHTFEQTFEEQGHHLYVCTPHEDLEMKGAVVIGDAGAEGGAGGTSRFTLGAITALLLAPVAVALALLWSELQSRRPTERGRSAEHGRQS